jgi:ABC-type multidrug transport system fused ATPase/permease subunit
MSNRSWFFAADGQQRGPYPDPQFRDFIARGIVTAETLIWTEGMAGWQKAGDVPGLVSPPPPPARSGGAVTGAGYGGNSLSIDFDIWEFTWRIILLFLAILVVIPAPWAIVWWTKWFVGQIHVPGRPNLTFTGRPLTIMWWWYGIIALAICIDIVGNIIGSEVLDNLGSLAQLVLYWLFLRWSVANLASNGQPLGLSFSGSLLAYFGWTILALVSIITIIGWAWVYAAQMRWVCRNIQGTRRQVVFNGTGLEILWRMILATIASIFIIPIPWMWRWLSRWVLSQTELVERDAHAAA